MAPGVFGKSFHHDDQELQRIDHNSLTLTLKKFGHGDLKRENPPIQGPESWDRAPVMTLKS